MATDKATPPKTPSSEAYLVDMIKGLQKQVTDLQKVNKHSLSRLTPDQEKGMNIMVSTYKARETDEPKLVIGWETLQNHVDYSQPMKIENQIIELTLEDEKKVKLEYREFAVTALQKVEVVVISTTQKDGKKFYSFKFNDKEYTLSEQFIN